METEIIIEKFNDMGFDLHKKFVKIGKNEVSLHSDSGTIEIKNIKNGFLYSALPIKYIDCIKETEKSIIIYSDNHWCYKKIIPKGRKVWSNTMCFAWFIWEIGYEGEPIIKWL